MDDKDRAIQALSEHNQELTRQLISMRIQFGKKLDEKDAEIALLNGNIQRLTAKDTDVEIVTQP